MCVCQRGNGNGIGDKDGRTRPMRRAKPRPTRLATGLPFLFTDGLKLIIDIIIFHLVPQQRLRITNIRYCIIMCFTSVLGIMREAVMKQSHFVDARNLIKARRQVRKRDTGIEKHELQ